MEIVRDFDACKSALGWRRGDKRVGLVATMGSLHSGHLALINSCRAACDITVVSVYVNPLLFSDDNAFADYPRRLEHDASTLEKFAVDFLFAPRDAEMFPAGRDAALKVTVPTPGGLLDQHSEEAGARATVALKLLNIVAPEAFFVGEKDYQQALQLKRLVTEFGLDTEVILQPVVRDADGVAFSSELEHLTPEQRPQAAILHRTMEDIAYAIRNGARNYRKLEQTARVALRGGGFEIHQVAVRDAGSLEPPTEQSRELRILLDVQLGLARLTDNTGVEL